MRKVPVKKPKTVPYQEYLNLLEKYEKLREQHAAFKAKADLVVKTALSYLKLLD